jgi:ribosomal protein L37E
MEPKKTMVCTCEKCGNEAEMTVKCEVVLKEAPPAEKLKRTVVCTRCGNEADMIVDYAAQ